MRICVRKEETLASPHRHLEPCCMLVYRYMTKEELEADLVRERAHFKEHMKRFEEDGEVL